MTALNKTDIYVLFRLLILQQKPHGNICLAIIKVFLYHHAHNVSHIRTTHTDNHQIAMKAEVPFQVIESMVENTSADM